MADWMAGELVVGWVDSMDGVTVFVSVVLSMIVPQVKIWKEQEQHSQIEKQDNTYEINKINK